MFGINTGVDVGLTVRRGIRDTELPEPEPTPDTEIRIDGERLLIDGETVELDQ
ncbi:hypothetical protein [Amaricoccus tamworthensis]|uniref:hypothetical protein n=1 Tax=Amaricoccus tamworthensis TaxID=57002 RepID=UPI003C7D51A0